MKAFYRENAKSIATEIEKAQYLFTPTRRSGSFGTGSSPPSINDCTLSKLMAGETKQRRCAKAYASSKE